jgi:hypothetical protein
MVSEYQNMGTRRLEKVRREPSLHCGGLAHPDLVFLSKLVAFFTRHVIECVMVSLEQSTLLKVGARTREGGTFPPVTGGSAIVYENICRFAGGALAGNKLCGSREYNWADSSRGH